MRAMTNTFAGNRVVRDTGCRYPILNAPVGYFARASLTGAISAAGGFGLMETSSQGLAETAAEFDAVRRRTDAPLGLQMFLRVLKQQDRVDEVLDWILDGRTPLVGDVRRRSGADLEAGARGRREALPPGRQPQGGAARGRRRRRRADRRGRRERRPAQRRKSPHLMTLLQQVRAAVDVPIVAAGGIVDGRGMAAAFALGAEGVLMGTRFMSAAESPAHQGWKQAIADTDITLNIAQAHPEVTMRVVRTEFAEAVQRGDVPLNGNPYAGPFMEAFEHGRIDLAMVGAGESATLVEAIKPVADIIDETVTGFWREIERLAGLLQPAPVE